MSIRQGSYRSMLQAHHAALVLARQGHALHRSHDWEPHYRALCMSCVLDEQTPGVRCTVKDHRCSNRVTSSSTSALSLP